MNTLWLNFQRLLSHDLIRHNAIFFIGTIVISALNYLFFPVIGRLVSVTDFGEIQAIIAIFTQLGIVLTAFGYVVTNITNNSKTSDLRNQAILSLERIVMVLCIALFIIICISSVFLKSSLQFSSILPLILVGLLILLNVPSTSRAFFLQGMKRLKEVSISGIIFAAGKLLLSVLLIVMFKLDVVMVVVAYIIAQFFTLAYLQGRTRRLRSKKLLYLSLRDLKSDLIYGIAVIVLLSGITLLYASDAIVIRLFFDPIDSGFYSGVSAVSRIVFFVTASVAGVLIATIKMNEQYPKNLAILYRSMGIVTVIGGFVALFFALFPSFSVSLLIGSTYEKTSHLLPLLALLMLICSYNNLLICFEIALRRFKVIYTVVLSIVVGGVLISIYNDTLTDIVLGYLAANIIVFVLLSIQIVMRKKNV